MGNRLFIFLIALSYSAHLFAARGRNEVSRYSLLRDRAINDRQLKMDLLAPSWEKFFSIDLFISSGTKTLVGDIEDATSSSSSTTNAVNVLNVLNQEVNSERYLDLDLRVASPLPYLKVKQFKLLPTFFVHLNLGASLSFSNQEDATNPSAQIYVKADQKIGIASRMKWKNSEEWQFAFYRMEREDLYIQRDASSIATKGKLYSFDDATTKQTSYQTDLRFIKKQKKFSYLFELQELKLFGDSSDLTFIGGNPFVHGRAWMKMNQNHLFEFTPFAGIHYREKYTLLEGIYLGSQIHLKTKLPFTGMVKLSDEFLSLMFKTNPKWVHFSYMIKLPYNNPQDEIWVPAIHSVNLEIPFP